MDHDGDIIELGDIGEQSVFIKAWNHDVVPNCYVIDVDGEPVRYHGDHPPDEKTEAALREIVRLVKRTPPEVIADMDARLKELRRNPHPGGECLMHRRCG